MNLYLDCEWADPEGQQLVSLALISEDGEQAFYAERDPLPAVATEFVRGVVYPRLDRGSVALNDAVFTRTLREFLLGFERPCAIYDHALDGHLLRLALSGFNLTDMEAAACGPIPRVQALLIGDNGAIAMFIEDWFDAHPKAKAKRHHALVDAEALRMAHLAATGRIKSD